jgi:hypothetical protein
MEFWANKIPEGMLCARLVWHPSYPTRMELYEGASKKKALRTSPIKVAM